MHVRSRENPFSYDQYDCLNVHVRNQLKYIDFTCRFVEKSGLWNKRRTSGQSVFTQDCPAKSGMVGKYVVSYNNPSFCRYVQVAYLYLRHSRVAAEVHILVIIEFRGYTKIGRGLFIPSVLVCSASRTISK